MTIPNEEIEFRNRIQHLEALLEEIDGAVDPAAQARIRDIVQTLLEFHGTGLARIVDYLQKADAPGQALLRTVGNDDLAGTLLILHGLHPLDLDTRVRQALDKLQPKLLAQGGAVELVSIRDGNIRLRVIGSGHGCHSTPAKLKQAVEDALYAKAPDAVSIQIDGIPEGPAQASAAFIPAEQLLVRK